MADKKVIDVTQPKDAKVDIGSKPMIVGHKSMASDPMMREAEEDKSHSEPTVEDPKIIEEVSKSDPVIAPPSERQKIIEPLKAKSEVVEETKKNSDVKNDKAEVEGDENKSAEQAEIDPAALALEQEEVIRRLLEDKKYRVSIKQARNTNKMPLFVAVILLLVGAITAFILIDTKKLDIGVELPFSIFGESETAVPVTQTALAPVVEQKVLESASWLKFDTDNYSMRIPDGWVVTSVDGQLYAPSYDQMVYKLGEAGVVIQEKTSTETDCCLSVKYAPDEITLENYEDESLAYTATPIILDTGVQAIRYERTLAMEESDTMAEGTKLYDYVVKNDAGETVVVQLTVLPDSTFKLDQVDLAVKSIIIN